MNINNSQFGGFVVSKNIFDGKAVRYLFRKRVIL